MLRLSLVIPTCLIRLRFCFCEPFQGLRVAKKKLTVGNVMQEEVDPEPVVSIHRLQLALDVRPRPFRVDFGVWLVVLKFSI